MKTSLIKLKEKLQFTGWLQYILTAVVATILLVVALLLWVLIDLRLAVPILTVSFIFYIAVLMDIITIKFKLHPQEVLPKRNDELNLFDLMRERISCRAFQTRQLRKEDLKELMSLVTKEMATVNNKVDQYEAIRFEYISQPLTVWPVVNASEFIVAIGPKDYRRKAIINIGRSLQKVVLHATRMGIATCWIGPGADQTSIIEQMGESFDQNNDHIVCVCAIGYGSKHMPLSIRLMSKSQKRRLPISELFFKSHQFTEPLKVDDDEFRHFGRCFEICQWAPSSFNGQTTRAVAAITKSGEVKVDFYCSTNSRFYGPLALGIWCGNWELGCEAIGIDGDVLYLQHDSGEHEVPRYGVSWKGNKH